MASSRRKLIERILALWARGRSSFTEEGRTSLKLAQQLMDQHGITFSELGTGKAVVDSAVVLSRAHMQKLGRKGGKARTESLTAEERSEIARKAARARWERK